MKATQHAMRVTRALPLPQVAALAEEIAISQHSQAWLEEQRQEVNRIISGEDSRLLIIVGPCSIHDPVAGLEYAERLAELNCRYRDKFLLVMRTYFEKPRTRHGWKGLVIDPAMNGSYAINDGLRTARQFLKAVLELGVPTATEFLDTALAPYLVDLICWGAIGARTVESQPHRQLASALPCAIGFKNSTDGNINIAIDAIHAASVPQLLCNYAGAEGAQALVTEGNAFGHLILRGGAQPNYSREDIAIAFDRLQTCGVTNRLIVDCSHGNSGKKAQNQPAVAQYVINQIRSGEKAIAGIMLESFLIGGNQPESRTPLVYGQSITDECLSWHETEMLLEALYQLH